MIKKYIFNLFKVICLILIYKLFSGIASRLLSNIVLNMLDIGYLATGIGSFVTCILIFIVYYKKSKNRNDLSIFPVEKTQLKKFLKGSLEGICIAGLGVGILFILGLIKIDEVNAKNLISVFKILSLGFVNCLLFIAIPQELLARGCLLDFLKSKFTLTGSILITSFFYPIIFSSNFNYLYSVNMFVFSIIACLLMTRDSSLYTTIGFSFGLNYILETIFSTIGPNNLGLINTTLVKYDILTGGNDGILGGLFFTFLLLILLLYILIKNSKCHDFIFGLKSFGKIALLVLIIISTIFYTRLNKTAWSTTNLSTDNSTLNTINKFQNCNNYSMNLRLNTKNKEIYGEQTVSYINNSNDILNEVYFHIYPNAFVKNNGSISIKAIKVSGVTQNYEIEGEDKTLLKIPLISPLKSGERAEIFIEFVAAIPKKSNGKFFDRFAYGNDTYNLGNFFPIAAVYGIDGWDKHLYSVNGDPFFSEVSNFSVYIEAPSSQIVASSGEVKKVTNLGKTKKWEVQANAVRDFAFVSSNSFAVEECVIDGTVVKSYAKSIDKARHALEIGVSSLKIYNEKYGKYPYPSLSIVQTEFNGGMEYPNLIMISTDFYRNIRLFDYYNLVYFNKYNGDLESFIVHEVAHQWWYGMVGNDQFNEAWVDESITCYSALTYYKHMYSEEYYNLIYDKTVAYKASPLRKYNPQVEHKTRRALDEFEKNEYYLLVYVKGPLMYRDLLEEIGEDKFYQFQKTIFERYKFKILTGEGLIKTASEIAGKDMSKFFDKWLNTEYMGGANLYPDWLQQN